MENFATPTFPGTAGLERLDQEIFSQILQAHALWLNSEGKEGRRANLKDTDLRHISFQGANLVQASLRGVNLDGVDLRGAMLQEADFTEAKLVGSNLSGLELRRVNFASAHLDRAVLEQADVSYCNFLNAHLNEANLRGANMERSILRQVQSARADFTGANLRDANGRESNFTAAKFHDTLLERTDLRDSKFDYAEFVNTRFAQTPFKGSSFNGVSFTQADFKEALEISPEYRSAAYKEEKAAIEGQLQEVRRKEAELAEQRQALERKLSAFDDLARQEESANLRLRSSRKTLGVLTAIFGVLTLLILGGIALVAMSLSGEQLNMAEIGLVAFISLLLFCPYFVALLKVRGAAQQLEDVVALRERKLMALHSGGVNEVPQTPTPAPALFGAVPTPSDELTLNLPETARRKGLFGKKA
jgi:uncharacterized protein YjbI with pentapeptide repeats